MLDTTTDERVRRELEDFLYLEGELLDNRQLSSWLALLSPDIDYRVPTRVTRERRDGMSEFSDESFHMIEDLGSLTARVQRLETDSAWSESPPSRTRRFISNVRVRRSDVPGQVQVKSNILLYWSRDQAHQLISAERHDGLRRGEDGWLLARRTVFLDHVSLPTPNFNAFL